MLMFTCSIFLLRIITSESHFDLFARAVNEKDLSHSPGWGLKTSSVQNGGFHSHGGTPLIDGLKWKILLKSYENWWFRGRNILGNLQIVRKLLGTSTKHPSPRGKKSFGGQANSQICQAAFLGESSTMEKSWVTSAETRPGQVYLVYIPPLTMDTVYTINLGYWSYKPT